MEGKTRRRGAPEVLSQVSGSGPEGSKRLTIENDRWVSGIRISFVTQCLIEVAQITSREQKRVVGRRVVDSTRRSIDRKVNSTTKHGFIDLDETCLLHRVQIERNVAFPARSRLGNQAGVSIDRSFEEIGDALVERIDPCKHPLDPPLGKGWAGPLRPTFVRATRLAWLAEIAVAHDVVVITNDIDA